jgi:hypothetical protein
VRLESISDALGVFSAASYDATASQIARRSMLPSKSKDTIRGLRTSARWPMRTAGAVMRSDWWIDQRATLQDILIALRTTWSERGCAPAGRT